MSFFKNFIRKRQIKKLSECNRWITYYTKTAESAQKCADEFQKVLDKHHSIKPKDSDNYCKSETGIYWLNINAKAFIKEIAENTEIANSSLGKIEYWQTIKKELLKQLNMTDDSADS